MTRITNFFKAIACITCLTVQINSVSAQWTSPINGNGSAASPWEITTIAHLKDLADYVNAGNGNATQNRYYKLMNNIAYNSTIGIIGGWDPIGNNVTPGAIFQGNFDGNGNVVSNIRINRSTTPYIGLFGYVSDAHIHDLGIEIAQTRIIGGQYVGALIGRADHSTIENCYAAGNITGTSEVGGLVGWLRSGAIVNSYAACNVSGTNAGGFVGANNGNITDCYATGDVTGTSYLGGFVGLNRDGFIAYCYATGDITATGDFIGGLVGENFTLATLISCVAANNVVTGGVNNNNINRVAGINAGTLSNNYAYNGMLITPHNGDPGIPASMAALMSFSFYNMGSNWYSNRPWRIDTNDNPHEIWKICNGETLPFLQWQSQWIVCNPPCTFTTYGTGTQGTPYLIYYPCQLEDLAIFVNQGGGAQTIGKYFRLMNNIDLIDYSYGAGWDPIGNNKMGGANFQGNFDGNGKVVSNIRINQSTTDYIGLFGCVYGAHIHGLGIEIDQAIIGGHCVGGLMGRADYSTIENCYVTGNGTITGTSFVGGLVGATRLSTIRDSYAICEVSGATTVGGFIGESDGAIETSYAAGDVIAKGNQIGGFVGTNRATTVDCYAKGDVFGPFGIVSCIGGFAGVNERSLTYCYATGDITVTGSYIGGLAGTNFDGATIRNCVAANKTVSGGPNNVGRVSGTNTGTLSNNYAYDNMVITPSGSSYAAHPQI